MDLADASLVATAETELLKKAFTIEQEKFAAYRVKRGHRYYDFEMIG